MQRLHHISLISGLSVLTCCRSFARTHTEDCASVRHAILETMALLLSVIVRRPGEEWGVRFGFEEGGRRSSIAFFSQYKRSTAICLHLGGGARQNDPVRPISILLHGPARYYLTKYLFSILPTYHFSPLLQIQATERLSA